MISVLESSNKSYVYSLSWTRSNGEKVKDQLYTSEYMSRKLQELERDQATDITITVIIK